MQLRTVVSRISLSQGFNSLSDYLLKEQFRRWSDVLKTRSAANHLLKVLSNQPSNRSNASLFKCTTGLVDCWKLLIDTFYDGHENIISASLNTNNFAHKLFLHSTVCIVLNNIWLSLLSKILCGLTLLNANVSKFVKQFKRLMEELVLVKRDFALNCEKTAFVWRQKYPGSKKHLFGKKERPIAS